MNNFDEWTGAVEIIRSGLEKFGPHFEILENPDGEESIIMFFAMLDTEDEWKLFQSIPEEYAEEFAENMQEAKAILLEKIGFDFDCWNRRQITKSIIDSMNDRIERKITEYQKRKGQSIKKMFCNMIIYSEWLQLPEEIMEERYEQEVNAMKTEY